MTGSLPGLVLVHGGAHSGNCWELVIAELSRRAPELRVLAVDLPGRGGRPADLGTVSVRDWVDAVVADIDEAGFRDIVIVGHSLAGVTVPGVVAKLGATRVREMVLVAAFVPPPGRAVADSVRGPLRPLARLGARLNKPFPLPALAARIVFFNGMTRQQRRLATSRLCPESPRVIAEKVDRCDVPATVRRTWIMTVRDRALSVGQQQASIAALGGVDDTIYLDACHDVMFSEPERLAAILLQRCSEPAKRGEPAKGSAPRRTS